MNPDRRRALLAGAAGWAVLLPLAALAGHHLRHGLTVTWATREAGETLVVDRRVEHRTTFPNAYRPVSRYVQAWDFETLGVPDHIPSLDATLEGILDVPPGPPRIVKARTSNAVEIRVDGEDYREAALQPGPHSIVVHWHGSLDEPTLLKLRWGAVPHRLEEIPAGAFSPKEPAERASAARLSALVFLAAALMGCGLFWAQSPGEPERRGRRSRWVLGTLIIAVGLAYRSFDYEVMPDFRENNDELSATWNGWQLLTDGTTRGWSIWHKVYGDAVREDKLAYFERTQMHVVVPFLDHPPLLHLLAGAAAKLGGATHWSYSRLKYVRVVPILLSAISLGLLLAIGFRLDASGPAPYMAGLLYAVLPMIVLQNRTVKEDALLVPLSLGGILFFLRWREQGERPRDLAAAALLMGVSTLAKATGAAFVPALAILVAERGRRRAAFLALATGAAAAGLFFVYGALIDWQAFRLTTALQATGRGTQWNLYTRFFANAMVNKNWIGRGWMIFLWLAFLGSSGKRPRHESVLIVPTIVFLAGVSLGSGNWTYGWYAMPLYPFLCLGAGRFLADLWEEPDLLRGALLVMLPISYAMSFTLPLDWAREAENWPFLRRDVFLLSACFLGPYALAQAFPTAPMRWLGRVTTALALALLTALSGHFVANYDAIYDQYRNFDRMDYLPR